MTFQTAKTPIKNEKSPIFYIFLTFQNIFMILPSKTIQKFWLFIIRYLSFCVKYWSFYIFCHFCHFWKVKNIFKKSKKKFENSKIYDKICKNLIIFISKNHRKIILIPKSQNFDFSNQIFDFLKWILTFQKI